jgi:hypothetical protein
MDVIVRLADRLGAECLETVKALLEAVEAKDYDKAVELLEAL